MRHHATYYLALERYLLNHTEGEYFFTWDIFPTIVCGKHQLLQAEVNLEYLRSIGAEVTRRHSGGGTVFADEGDFMFTFILRDRTSDLFARTLTSFADSLHQLGVNAMLTGRNDLTLEGRKFSGNAFYRNEHGTIVHGTMMYDVDIEKLVRSLTPDNEKLISKGIASVRQRVINLKPYLNGMTREELMQHLEQSINMPMPELTAEECSIIDSYEKEYRTDEWIWGNNPKFSYTRKERFAWGGIELQLESKANRIEKIAFYGDFFPRVELTELYSTLCGREINEHLLDNINIDNYIMGATNENILKLFP